MNCLVLDGAVCVHVNAAYVEDVWLSSISAYYSVSFSLSCCSELRQETLVRTQAAKRSSQFEEGEDKAAELQKQVKKFKSEKRAVEDVSCCQVELLVCVFLCVFCVLSLILRTCVQFQVHIAACHVLTVEQVHAPHRMVHFLYITYVHTYIHVAYVYVCASLVYMYAHSYCRTVFICCANWCEEALSMCIDS